MSRAVVEERDSVEGTGYEGLISFLKSQPYRTSHSAKDLATRYGLEESFVNDVLETLRGSPNKLTSSESFRKAFKTTWQGMARTLSHFTDDFSQKPYVSLPLTLILAVALVIAVRWLAMLGVLGPTIEDSEQARFSTNTAIFVATCALHGFCLFKNGRMRFALYGAACVFAATVASFILLTGSWQVGGNNASQPLPLLGLLVAVAYFAIFGTVSLVGGLKKASQADRREARVSRQELLDRLFVLQENLRSQSTPSLRKRWRSMTSYMRTTPWLPVIGLTSGLTVGVIGVFLRGYSATPSPRIGDAYESIARVPAMLDLAIVGLTIVAIGYLSGGPKRSVIALTLLFGGKLLTESIPYSLFGPQYIRFLIDSGKMILGLELTILIALILGVGSHIDARARVRQRLQENDPAALLAEIVEIQWRLNPSQSATCVLVVDVAGSTGLKQDADPLHVEYSFRAFQDLIERLSRKRGGSVLSQAGDGAVVSFGNSAEALYVAKEIQTELPRFNSDVNRLSGRFRARIGIHSGKTATDLAAVPFNELIDIAAHVERVAPVGGIAVTKQVAAHVQDEPLAEVMEKVDGQTVFIVLNPTLSS